MKPKTKTNFQVSLRLKSPSKQTPEEIEKIIYKALYPYFKEGRVEAK